MKETSRPPGLGNKGTEKGHDCRRPDREKRVWRIKSLVWNSEQGILGWSHGDRAEHAPTQGFRLGLFYLHIQGKDVLGKCEAWDMSMFMPFVCTSFSLATPPPLPPPSPWPFLSSPVRRSRN